MRKNQSGFTLVEIAIVLVIIGLLLAGILKGQDLIASAKAKAVVNDFRNTLTMITAYQDRFRVLPGDDPSAQSHLGDTAAQATGSAGNGRIDGAWDSITATDESVLLWQHLRLANLATGNTAAPSAAADLKAWLPLNAEGGAIGISATRPNGLTANVRGSQFICQGNISGRIAQQVDTTMDDGKPDNGSVGAFEADGTSTSSYDQNKTYVVCYGF